MKETKAGDEYEGARRRMIEHDLRRRGVVMHSVLEAMKKVPRHEFVAPELAHRAYADEALPSQEGQTISQPYMVAAMTQELAPRPGDRILELGTGTGYQTAILAELAGPEGHVYTIERIEGLALAAEQRLERLGYRNVSVYVGDGSAGWPRELWPAGERGPEFERILVTAGSPEVPGPLVEQLSPAGVMIIPLRAPGGEGEAGEILTRVRKTHSGVERTALFACRFVPLLGRHAFAVEEEGERGDLPQD